MRLVAALITSLLLSPLAQASSQFSLGMGMKTKILPNLSSTSMEAQSEVQYFFAYDLREWEVLVETGQWQSASQTGSLKMQSKSYALAPWVRHHWPLANHWGSFLSVGTDIVYQQVRVNMVGQSIRKGSDTGLAPGIGAGLKGEIYQGVAVDGEARIKSAPFQKLTFYYELGLKMAVRF